MQRYGLDSPMSAIPDLKDLQELDARHAKKPFNQRPTFFLLVMSIVSPIIYGIISRIWSGKLFYIGRGWVYGITVLFAFIPLLFGRNAFGKNIGINRRWPLYTFVVTAAAVVGGAVYGSHNYWQHGHVLYQIGDLASYNNVDPSQEVGQSFMDSGILYFKEQSYVDKSRAIAFKSYYMYCAAPIVSEPLGASPPKSGTVDFWAVGVDCCESDGQGFTCGEVNDPLARSGIRLTRDDQRPFFNLAVQEWVAQYNLPAKHSLFYQWVVDPVWNLQVTQDLLEWTFWWSFFAFTGLCWIVAIAAYWNIKNPMSQGERRKLRMATA